LKGGWGLAESTGLRLRLIGALALTLLWSCGGGGGGRPRPAPQNSPPVFTSPASISVPENSGGAIYMATASDADGNALTFSLAGGPDQALFRIDPAGSLSFATPPDFELPADADRNNTYLVRLGVSDGQTSATLDLTVTVTNGGNDAFRVSRVGAGFTQPLYASAVPDGSGRIFVVEKPGRIRILTPSTGAISAPFLDLSGQISDAGEGGLLGFAAAPDFNATGSFYVFVTNTAADIEVRRYRTLAGNRNQADPASGDVVLTIPHPTFTNHYGGWIDFGPDGFLYIAVGDGGGGGDPSNNAQNTAVLLGKMLRIDVAQDAFPGDLLRDYAIPAGNPFAAPPARPEIWAYGLRNPFRNSFDSATGNLLIGDVGQGAVEEIDLMRPADGGANFGWSFREGTRVFREGGPAALVPPVAEYSAGSGPREGRSVTGGYVYRGPVEALRGQYIFGDFVTGNIWSLPIGRLAVGATVPSSEFILRRADFAPSQGAITNITSFGLDQSGNLYIVDFDGEIFRVEPA
jgi:Glucose / Sorbosone dehydrogenase